MIYECQGCVELSFSILCQYIGIFRAWRSGSGFNHKYIERSWPERFLCYFTT